MSLSLPRSRRLFWLAAFGFLPACVLLLAIVNAVYAVPIGGVSIDATASATPADGSVTINVALAGPLTDTVTAQYTTVDGTATSPADYTAQSGTVIFAPGVPDQQITIAITNPGTGAPNKSFTVVLSNVSSPGWLVNSTCTVTIVETPPATVQFSSATFSVNETAGSETITVVLSGPPSAVATVNYATSDGTGKHPAIAGKNYTATSGTLTFNPSDPSPANTTQSFTVPITNSGKPGPNRSLNLTLSSPSGATLGTPSRAVLTIDDDYPRSVRVTATGGTFSPNPAPVGTWVHTRLSAKAKRPSPHAPATLSPPSWDWQFASVERSSVSVGGPWEKSSGGGVSYFVVSDPTPPPGSTFDRSTVSLFASFSKGAYWQIGYNATVSYTDAAGNAYEGTAAAQGTGAEFEVAIRRSLSGVRPFEPLADDKVAAPGSLIKLKAEVTPAVDVKFKWTKPDGKAFKSYKMDDKEGKLTLIPDADLDNQILQFYWADSGEKALECKVTGKGGFKFAKGTMMIDKPSISPKYDAKQGSVRWWDDFFGRQDEFGLYAKTNKKGEGMEFTATVNVPPGYSEGKWAFVQTVVPSGFRTLKNPEKKQHFSLNGKTILDSQAPYVKEFDTGKPGETGDSPNSGKLEFSKVKEFAFKDQKFKMYIMFLPAGSNTNWVPLQYWGEWSFKGTATFAKGEWRLTNEGQSPGAVHDTADHPVWDNNVKNMTWEAD